MSPARVTVADPSLAGMGTATGQPRLSRMAQDVVLVVDGGGRALVGVTPEGVATRLAAVTGLDAPVLVDGPGADVVDLGANYAVAGEDVAELV